MLRVGDEIEVRPGIVSKDSEGGIKCVPIMSRIISLKTEKNQLKYAVSLVFRTECSGCDFDAVFVQVPGGLIGVGTKIDPTLTRADRLVGQVTDMIRLIA